MASRYSVAIVGAHGYAGQVLHALLMHHPCIDPEIIEAREPDDRALAACAAHDRVALATPSEAARIWTTALMRRGQRVLDLSDAHRLDPQAHYGLPELMGPPTPNAPLVANPGCYPTASLLMLRPLLDARLCHPEPIAIMGASGASGAGKGLRPDLHFCELAGNVFPYKVGRHRHIPEIEHVLGTPVSFVTQLLPIVRGMLVTAFVRPRASPQHLLDGLRAAHEAHPWVSVLSEPGPDLGLRHVVGTHQALIAVGPVERSGLVPVFCAIDNLMRGAASQAVHNLNLWLGLSPDQGLPDPLTIPPKGLPGMSRMLP
ncbi:MAG: Asd/ArgC dimerization domain-containing protein [Myxococcota bacterium]